MKRIALVPAVMLVALSMASTTRAASITVFSGDFAGWTAAAGAPVVVEDFSDAVLVPGFNITFGSSLPGSISGGEYHDRADDTQATKPTFSFGGGVSAFGGDWDLAGPGGTGTGLRLFLTFTDLSTVFLATEIPASFSGDFFGLVSDMAIASIRFETGTQSGPGAVETFDLDNARFVPASVPVPEPASLLLVGTGLAIAVRRGWRNRTGRA